MVLVISIICSAAQISINVDRMAMVEPSRDSLSTQNTLAAIHFTLPRMLDSVKISYAEIVIPFDFSGIRISGESMLELQAYPIAHEWTPESAWNNPWSARGNDLDTLSSFSYTITMGDRNRSRVYMDVTPFIKEIAGKSRQNYGLMISPRTFETSAFQMPQSIIQQIGNSAILRITYR
jgi:hypothetical protein